MTVSISLQEQRQTIYQIKLEDNYNELAELKIVNIDNQQYSGFEMHYSIHCMPGFCLIDERVDAQRYDTIDIDVKGNCHIACLYNSGKFEITDYERCLHEFYMAGSIKSSSSVNSKWGLSVYSGDHTHRYIIIFSNHYLSKLLENERWYPNSIIWRAQPCDKAVQELSKSTYIDSPIKNLLDEISNASYESNYRRAYIELKIKELIFLSCTQQDNSDAENNLPPTVYQKLMQAKAYLISNYVEAPSIVQLARIVSLNELYLKMYYKELFGITIHQFIIRLRMEAADKLLRKNCSVLETSARTGYRSTSHFISVFKTYYGKTPKQAMKI